MNLYIFGRKDHETRDSGHICLDVVGTHNETAYCKNKLMRVKYCHVYKLGWYQLIIFYSAQFKNWNIFFNLLRYRVPERLITIYLFSVLIFIHWRKINRLFATNIIIEYSLFPRANLKVTVPFSLKGKQTFHTMRKSHENAVMSKMGPF